MSEFATLRVRWDWLPAPGVKAPELRATWASLEIYVDSQCVTLVEDVESTSARHSILVPLYPLAEWIAFHWWSLVADSRPIAALSRLRSRTGPFFVAGEKAHRARHGFRAAGDGFLWPDLYLLPDGRNTYLYWRADRSVEGTHPIRYLTGGEAVTSSEQAQRQLRLLVEEVIARLREQGVNGTPLESEWRVVQEADPEEEAYCRAAARLGLDPYAEAPSFEGRILEASEALGGGPLLDDFLDAVEPAAIAEGLDWVLGAQAEIRSLTSAGGRVADLRAELNRAGAAPVVGGSRPWETGWAQARQVRQILSRPPEAHFKVEALAANIDRPGPRGALRAVGAPPRPHADPVVVTARGQHPAALRFTLARALWRALSAPAETFLITSAYTYRQKVERAFAAELLAPAQGISAAIEGDVVEELDDDLLDELAGRYGVSPMVIQHQVENQLLPLG